MQRFGQAACLVLGSVHGIVRGSAADRTLLQSVEPLISTCTKFYPYQQITLKHAPPPKNPYYAILCYIPLNQKLQKIIYRNHKKVQRMIVRLSDTYTDKQKKRNIPL